MTGSTVVSTIHKILSMHLLRECALISLNMVEKIKIRFSEIPDLTGITGSKTEKKAV